MSVSSLSGVSSESNTLFTYVMSYQSEHGCKKEFNQTCWHISLFMGLKCKLPNVRGVAFDFNTQQNVVEMLQVILDELKGVSLAASYLISNTQ